jgi:hypothetical protein
MEAKREQGNHSNKTSYQALLEEHLFAAFESYNNQLQGKGSSNGCDNSTPYLSVSKNLKPNIHPKEPTLTYFRTNFIIWGKWTLNLPYNQRILNMVYNKKNTYLLTMEGAPL